ncbi:c-type cytochrome [Massilia glaciei]|uniref:Cytochrome c n=1 Tax=Massilia glaciei TaxID=1524097 RepID=A0A2U2HP32_9BURK|nr:cytochrome c [Massilia glaciei]PWF49175.1 cytochrome c [Massilia glaciei]
MKKKILTALAALAALIVLACIAMWPRAHFVPSSSAAAFAPSAANIARGDYLAKAGDCMACHTVRGGAPYAGGRMLATPFGQVAAPNITPDPTHGIGNWSADDFWNALHNGKSRDGRLLYPAFPYTHYTKVTRDDTDALFAFMRSVPAQPIANVPHALRFPYNQQFMLAGWRLLYFKPAVFEASANQSAQWNRGAYLVEGLGHCSACHSSRNQLGASDGGLSGGLIPVLGWYAPSLTSDAEAGLGGWTVPEIVSLLRTGVSPRATVFGPMAEVVQRSLQHLSGPDAEAMAVYLKALPATPSPAPAPGRAAPRGPRVERLLARGAKLYQTHCIDCHGADGKGLPPHYPPLAGNRALTMDSPVNAVRIVLNGGFAPSTAGNPRPYGMPPYAHVLGDEQVAAVVSYLRNSWGNDGAPVGAEEVNRHRAVPLD